MSAPGYLDNDGVAKLVARRRRVREWWSREAGEPAGGWDARPDDPAPVGLALSGGGIRSATFALGLIQALAKAPRDALGKIDVLSTVSGGGYCGSFLRSLFVPTALRGIDPPAAVPDLDGKIADQYRFARQALASSACEREIVPSANIATTRGKLRNPLWWLREHSRYLAPSGMTDFGFAIAYIARNWLAMTYLVVLAAVALGAALVSLEALALRAAGWPPLPSLASVTISPLLLLAAIPVAVAGQLMIAYWATQAMSTNERSAKVQRTSLLTAIGYIVGAALAVLALGALLLAFAPEPAAAARRSDVVGRTFLTIAAMGVVVCLSGAAIAWAVAIGLRDKEELLATELRRNLTAALAWANRILLLVIVLATLDSLGAWLDHLWEARRSLTAPGAVMLPVLAFVIKKIPDWFGGGGGGLGALLHRFATAVAFCVGAILYLMLAILGFATVHHAIWPGAAFTGGPDWWRMALLAGIAWVLAIVLGRSTGFINLSSLHSLYASRLTRAYLGASNIGRLDRVFASRRGAPVTENHPCDYIRPSIYGGTDLPAPLHVIGVTLNETIDPRSQIVARDRKGSMLHVEPDGVRERERLIPWAALRADPDRTRGAENISLGQWIAISGAAASSGMGRMSNLGSALAFTFANVRLGYWWWSPDLCPDVPKSTGASGWMGRHFGTFVYLFNEMTCRYSRGYARKYLTDGGHYENSGAYALIRRRVPLILVSDCGADPAYAFADLEALVRQVRIDLGGETTILGGNALDAGIGALGATDRSIFVDPHLHPKWRKRMLDPKTPAYVLMLRVVIGSDELTVIWVKPRLLPGVPTDIAGYQLAQPAFPQQPTGDQFFDEAQWESYRKLGEISMARLLETCPRLLA